MSCTWPRCSCKATGQYCDKKPKSGPKPKKAIARISEKGKLKKEDKKTLVQSDMLFYLDIWQEREHIDFETKEPIFGKPLIQYFHHVLEKRPKDNEHVDYSKYRHCKWNIVIVKWSTHNAAEDNLDNTPRIKAYTEKLRKLHEDGVLDTISPDKHFV